MRAALDARMQQFVAELDIVGIKGHPGDLFMRINARFAFTDGAMSFLSTVVSHKSPLPKM